MKRFVSVFAIFFVILILGCEKEKKTETKTETKTPPVINDFVLDGVLNNAAKFAISVEPGDLPLRETGSVGIQYQILRLKVTTLNRLNWPLVLLIIINVLFPGLNLNHSTIQGHML